MTNRPGNDPDVSLNGKDASITNNVFTMHPTAIRNFWLKQELIEKGLIVKEVGEKGRIEFLLVTASDSS